MTEHIFEVLGISSREDSYTDLIAYALEHNYEFRKNFLALLQAQDSVEWKIKVRPSVLIKLGRRKDIPDLILFNRKINKILLIENKVFSGEGWEQTKRYASDEFKKNLEEYLKMPSSNFEFFFLTLDGTEPCSPSFQSISYRKISECIPKIFGNSKLDILLKELKERIDEYYNWPPPKGNDVVLEYLKNTQRLVNSYRTFQIMTNNFLDKNLSFYKEWGKTANRGCGYIPFCLWYKKLWRGEKYQEEKTGNNCYDIHFEFQWNTRKDNLKLYLHYHTYPYMTKKNLEELNKTFREEYYKKRNDFFKFVKENAPQRWTINKSYLIIADHLFNKNITFVELKKKVNELINNMTPIIDNYLSEL